MQKIRKLVSTLMLGLSLSFSTVSPIVLPAGVATLALSSAACKESDLKKTAEAAKDIGGEVRDLIDAVGKAYAQKLITLAQKDRYADLLASVARGGQKGVDVIQALLNQGVTVPNASQRLELNRIFDDQVISPFLMFLTELGKLSDDSAIAIRTAMASVRAAILLFSSRVGRDDIRERIQSVQLREVWNV